MINRIDPKKRPPSLPNRWFFTDDLRVPDPLKVIETLDPTIGIIFRHYNHPSRQALAQNISTLCKARGQMLLIAGDLELAKTVKADGLHLPEHMLTDFTPEPNFSLITAACHNEAALKQACNLGVDGVFLSPIFTSQSHKDKKDIGEEGLLKLLSFLKTNSPKPTSSSHQNFDPKVFIPYIFVLGGMNEDRFATLIQKPAFETISGYGAIGEFLP